MLGYALTAAGRPAEARVVLTRPDADLETGVPAQRVERDALMVAVEVAIVPDPDPVPPAARALARSAVDRLDSELLTTVMRAPAVIGALVDALTGSSDPADVAARHRVVALARDHLRRHLARPEGDPGAAGFRAVPSVARLIERFGDVDPTPAGVASPPE